MQEEPYTPSYETLLSILMKSIENTAFPYDTIVQITSDRDNDIYEFLLEEYNKRTS